MITQDIVRKLLNYDDETGILTWKEKTSNSVKIGDIAGNSFNNKGYYQIGINGSRYKTARICFLHYHGYLPEVVDHINRDKIDNRISNLRACTNAENSCNRNSSKRGTSSYLGVSFFKQSNKWKSQIKKNGKVIYLGLFENEVDAAIAYNVEALRLHGEYANINSF